MKIVNEFFNEIKSKKLNEELSTNKEAFLILDKLSSDLKKIYDQDNYKVYEEERINKAINDLIELQIKFPLIKDLIHYVSQKTYERKYDPEDLLSKIGDVEFQYNNLNSSSDEDEVIEESLKNLKFISEGSYKDEFIENLQKLKEHGYLHYNYTIFDHHNNDQITLVYSNMEDIDGNKINNEEFEKLLNNDFDVLGKFNADIDDIDILDDDTVMMTLYY